ncbi:SdrD B-like domain-containing protein [Qipengyuania soli]|uniref:SD-repeat containing protein B domain-containing protein n=1 Tax=Qipengyuania soli TaxID=2782568 RepID=A0A7S8F4L5_9SPHN|nr:SdrD B-like domain-containing protein [Qipengyuania soli]QPC98908.1 hypothetical protein IRL76_13935 [Qipengyuania soli]
MSNRVFVRGAGVACLAAALVGYSLATDDNDYLPQLPGDGDDGDEGAPQKPFLRAPLPEPSFGASATRLPTTNGTSTSLKARRSGLLTSASRVPVAVDPARPSFVLPVAPAGEADAGPAPASPPAASAAAPDQPVAIAAPAALPAATSGAVPSFADVFGAPSGPAEAAVPGEATEVVPAAAPSAAPAVRSEEVVAEPVLEPPPLPPPVAMDSAPPPSEQMAEPITEAPVEAPFAQAEPGEIPPAATVPDPEPAPVTALPDNPPEVTVAVDPVPALAAAPAPAPASIPAAASVPASPAPFAGVADAGTVPAPASPATEKTDAHQGQVTVATTVSPEVRAPLAPIAPAQATSPAGTASTASVAPVEPVAELVPLPRQSSILGIPGTGEQVSGQPASIADDPVQLGMASNAPFSTTAGTPLLSYQDELILELKVNGAPETDTIIAYGTRGGLYLPLGAIARILDLAVTVTDEGRYAHGWVLSEDRTITIDLRGDEIELPGKTIRIDNTLATDFDGELYLRMDQFAVLFPVEVTADLRSQTVLLKTLETFPFEARRKREADREKLAAREASTDSGPKFDRVEQPYQAFSLPSADVELRAVSDRIYGTRMEGDILLAGDLGYLSADAYLSGDTKNGLVASLFKVGRMDPDADLLGPLKATAFSLGDIHSTTMALGLRSVSGRGLTLTNAPSQVSSVFDKVDIRGILPDGYEVELYRNDVLVGSTRDAVNGQYEFLRIPVDFGLNVFRLVFFGPQGQRSETVQRISVGDGRVPKGKLVYSMDLAQKDENLFEVRQPRFVPSRDFGSWRASTQLAYGLTSGLTGIFGGAWLQTLDQDRWLANAGLRTSIAGLAVKADAGYADGGATAFGLGIGGRFGRSAITVSHTEYGGEFPDETKLIGQQFLRRATEVDINTSLSLNNDNFTLPLSARFRNYLDVDGRNTLVGGLRASTRLAGLLVSNTIDYSRVTGPDIEKNEQLYGNFDLATISRGSTRARVSLGYQLMPSTDLTNATLEIDHAIDPKTSIRGIAGYDFNAKGARFGISGVRDFDRFSLALDSNYSFVDKSYYVGLRLGFSLGRDPLRGRMFMARPGLASSGGATVRAFRDLDGDGTFGAGDEAIGDVDFVAYNQTAKTDDKGVARLTGLGMGRAVSIQMDTTTLPDIDMAPAKPGLEVVPRAGRIHAIDYPVVSLSEIEGMARFADVAGERGVSGVRLQLVNEKGDVVAYAKTEVDGYYFFERVVPGTYRLRIDPDQLERLQLCPLNGEAVFVGNVSDVISRNLSIGTCAPAIARASE